MYLGNKSSCTSLSLCKARGEKLGLDASWWWMCLKRSAHSKTLKIAAEIDASNQIEVDRHKFCRKVASHVLCSYLPLVTSKAPAKRCRATLRRREKSHAPYTCKGQRLQSGNALAGCQLPLGAYPPRRRSNRLPFRVAVFQLRRYLPKRRRRYCHLPRLHWLMFSLIKNESWGLEDD